MRYFANPDPRPKPYSPALPDDRQCYSEAFGPSENWLEEWTVFGPSLCTTCGSGARMRARPAPRRGLAADRWLGLALWMAVATAMLAAGTGAWAEMGEAGAVPPPGDDRPADPGNAAVVDLRRQINEFRSDLLDERERRIERQREANGLVLVFLGIAISIGRLWTYAKFRSFADQASIGAAVARRYVPMPRGLLFGAAALPETPADRPGSLPYLVAADPESAPASPAGAAAKGSAGSAAVSGGNAVASDDRPGPSLDPEELRRHEEAIADCSEAIRLDPHDPALYLKWARARSAVARFEEAIADYDRAIRLDPDHAGTYLGRCRAKSELGRYEEAVEDYGRAVRLDPDSVAA